MGKNSFLFSLYLYFVRTLALSNGMEIKSVFTQVDSDVSLNTDQMSSLTVTHVIRCARLCVECSDCLVFSFHKSHTCVLYNSINEHDIVAEEGSQLFMKEVRQFDSLYLYAWMLIISSCILIILPSVMERNWTKDMSILFRIWNCSLKYSNYAWNINYMSKLCKKNLVIFFRPTN